MKPNDRVYLVHSIAGNGGCGIVKAIVHGRGLDVKVLVKSMEWEMFVDINNLRKIK